MEQVLREMENFVAQKLRAGYTVTRKVQTKNNGVVLQGFMITKADAPTISPVLYVNEYAMAKRMRRQLALCCTSMNTPWQFIWAERPRKRRRMPWWMPTERLIQTMFLFPRAVS